MQQAVRRSARRPTLAVLAALAGLLLTVVTGCGGSDGSDHDGGSGSGGGTEPTPPAGSQLVLDFDQGLHDHQLAQSVPNAGTAELQVTTHTSGSADIDVVKGPDGSHAIRFPEYTGLDNAPAAILVVTSPQDPGVLDPGTKDFTFGAVFQLDEKSSGSTADNGDNLVQSGTFDSPGQFKIQMDHDVPSCRVKGNQGEVFAKADGPIDPGAWYSVTCTRTASQVSLSVTALVKGAGGGTWTASGATGDISTANLPLTVGGKTGPDGTPVASPDQFNGVVDDVFLKTGS